MKKRNLFLTVLVAALFVGCSKDGDKIEVIPIENISDSSFRDYILERFDLDGDGEIDVDEAKAVTEISFNGSFDSFDGLQYFPNLKKLYINVFSSNTMPLDLSPNTFLEELTIDNSSVRFNISKNTNLQVLRCINNHGEMEIDLSNNRALKILVYNGMLQHLDISNNTELEHLDCSGNYALASLDLSKNLKIKTLNISGTSIKQIDISHLKELEEFVSSDLTSLDLSGNTSLKTLTAHTSVSLVAANSALEKITANAGKYLNLKGCIHLKEADLTADQIDLTGCESLAKLNAYCNGTIRVDGCTSLEDVSILAYATLTEFPSFTQCPELKSLTFYNPYFDVQSYHTMDISECPKLEYLSVEGPVFLRPENLEKMPELKYLKGRFSDSNLTLDLRPLTKLEEVFFTGVRYNKNAGDQTRIMADGLMSLKTVTARFVDVVSIVNCTALESIDIASYEPLDPSYKWEDYDRCLEGLDISGCISLKKLSCVGKVDLENLDTRSCLRLDTLRIYHAYPYYIYNIDGFDDMKKIGIKNITVGNIGFLDCMYVDGLDWSEGGSIDNLCCTRCRFTELSLDKACSVKSILLKECILLKVLDAKQCTSLEEITLQNNELLETVSLPPSLKTLTSSQCPLRELDLSQTTLLQTLEVSNITLTTLDVSKCKSLKKLSCYGDNLKKLIISRSQTIETIHKNSGTIIELVD